MAVNLASPGVNIREIDLTRGSVTQGIQNTAVIAGPFEKGPVNYPTLIQSEQQLLEIFGKPRTQDDQYEYWMSASNYLSYGGSVLVIRSDSQLSGSLVNANVGVSTTNVDLTIRSVEDYLNNREDDTTWLFSTKDPGTWGNNVKVAIIDDFADQTISGISTTTKIVDTFNVSISTTGTFSPASSTITGIVTTGISQGLIVQAIPGVISQATVLSVGSSEVTLNTTSVSSGSTTQTINFGSVTPTETAAVITVGMGVTQSLSNVSYVDANNEVQLITNAFVRGIVTGIGNSEIYVKTLEFVDVANNTINKVTYKNPGSDRNNSSFTSASTTPINIVENDGTVLNTFTSGSVADWYENQKITTSIFDGGTDNSTIYWKSIAQKPRTSQYASTRNSKNDEIHVVVVDDSGSISGTSGTIIEKFLNLSKATDGRISPSEAIYYKNYIRDKSRYIYVGAALTGTSADFSTSTLTTFTTTSTSWGTQTQNSKFSVVGARTYTLTGGTDYSTNTSTPFSVSLSDVISAYSTISNESEYDFDYILCGPSGGATIQESIAKANTLISIAENRKDCIVTVSPHKSGIVNVTPSETQTQNIIEFFDSVSSSSYAVFDSNYKYTFDRFNNRFVYLPCNSDIAGIMARTSIDNFPWFSPAGSNRGVINSAVKLAYNPSQLQRDRLYSNRINPVIASSGAGFILFGDKTALAYSSAFDRINVRKLFLTIEKSIEQVARAQLFEFNDAITRSNFVNIVEPYLRDVRAKRGISEFLIVCDETNNTPDVIDANEFRADIFVKPARSTNFVGLTFVATRTGVSFSEIVGTV